MPATVVSWSLQPTILVREANVGQCTKHLILLGSAAQIIGVQGHTDSDLVDR